MHQNLIILLKIGTEKKEISQTIGVIQGDNLLFILFLFLVSALAESLESGQKATGLSTSKFSTAT